MTTIASLVRQYFLHVHLSLEYSSGTQSQQLRFRASSSIYDMQLQQSLMERFDQG